MTVSHYVEAKELANHAHHTTAEFPLLISVIAGPELCCKSCRAVDKMAHSSKKDGYSGNMGGRGEFKLTLSILHSLKK